MHILCTRYAHDVHMMCTCCAHAMHTLCTRYAHAMHTPCTCYAHAMHMHLHTLCTCYAHAMHTLCTCYAHAMHTLCTCTRYAHAMYTPCTRYAHAMHMHLRELAERLVLRAAAVREVRADNVEARAYAVVLQLRLPHVHRTPCYCGFANRAIALRFGYWNAPLPHNFWPALTVAARRRYSRRAAAAYGPHYTLHAPAPAAVPG